MPVPGALYYPYIHIRDEHWLKATLLCTPTVKRIVPLPYTPEDTAAIKRYTEIQNDRGPLLQPSYPTARSEEEQKQLQAFLERPEVAAAVHSRFTLEHTAVEEEYWIHDKKIVDALREYLKSTGLAWEPRRTDDVVGKRLGIALNPTLGNAVMTMIGLSIATDDNLDIVTPNAGAHDRILSTKREDIFATIIGAPSQGGKTPAQARKDLAQLIFANTINLSALPPEELPELQASTEFKVFQELLRTTASTIPRHDDLRDYSSELKQAAKTISDAWQEAQNKTTLKRVAVVTGLTVAAEATRQYFGADPKVLSLLIEGALAIGIDLGTHAVEKGATDPYQYLTEIKRAEHETLRLTYPLGLH
jgi:hypothetical protein